MADPILLLNVLKYIVYLARYMRYVRDYVHDHSQNKHYLKKKTLDGGPNIITKLAYFSYKCSKIHSVSGQIHALRDYRNMCMTIHEISIS